MTVCLLKQPVLFLVFMEGPVVGDRRPREEEEDDIAEDERPHKNVLTHGGHPYGVQPWGNLYLQDNLNVFELARHKGLGRLSCLGDEDVLNILEFLDYRDLCRFAAVSKSFYIFCHHSDLWRTLVLTDLGNNFEFAESWKETYRIAKAPQFALKHVPIMVNDFFSDLLFQPWYCASVGIRPEWIEIDNIERRRNLSVQQFIAEYESKNKPVIITDCVTHWPAYERWDRQYLLSHHAGKMFTAAGFKFTLQRYFEMSDRVLDENPLYLFDARFGEKAPELAAEYEVRFGFLCISVCVADTTSQVPEYFREDLFSLLGENRPKYRWLIIGPARSGSNFHQDPNVCLSFLFFSRFLFCLSDLSRSSCAANVRMERCGARQQEMDHVPATHHAARCTPKRRPVRSCRTDFTR